jgi:hypothetical protein
VRPILLTALLGAALALAACGEKDEPAPVPAASAAGQSGDDGGSGDGGNGAPGRNLSGLSDEEQIETAAQAVIGGDDPDETCEKYAMVVYVKHAYGDVKGCRSAVAQQKPFAVDVSAIDVTGKTATAKAKPKGGPNQGETLKVDLIQEDGAWKVDLVRSNVKVGP